MDFDLPEELRMLKKTVGDFVERTTMDGSEMRPNIREKLKRKAKDLGLWRAATLSLCRTGLGLLGSPSRFGTGKILMTYIRGSDGRGNKTTLWPI
jgi:hypothetical protein